MNETGESYVDLIAEGSSTLNLERRKEIYSKIQEILVEEAWARGWLSRDQVSATQPYAHGFDWRVDNGILLENEWLASH